MYKVLKWYSRNALFRWFLLPMFFLLLGLVATLLYYLSGDVHATVFSQKHSLPSKPYSLKNGQFIDLLFTAGSENLGIIGIDFHSNKEVNGKLIFKLKQKDHNNWIVENSFSTKELIYIDEYPFGFPIIKNSIGQDFIIQLQFSSDDASELLVIEIGSFTSKYVFDSSSLLSRPQNLVKFIFFKLRYFFIEERQLIQLAVYFSPFVTLCLINLAFSLRNQITLLVRKISGTTWFKEVTSIVFHYLPDPYPFILLVIMMEHVYISSSNSLVIVFITVMWIIYILVKKLESTSTFLHMSVLSAFSIPFVLLGQQNIFVSIVTTIFMVFVIAVVQSIIEYRAKT